jgi:hypothetical protein
MLITLDKNKPYQTVYGASPCRFKQEGRFFDGPGNEMTEKQTQMSNSDYIAFRDKGKEPEDAPVVDVIAELNEKDPNAAPGDEGPAPPKMIGKGTRLDYEVLLQRYTSHALKKVLLKEGLEPITGVGSTAQNIALLLDHKFPEGE